MIDGVTLSEAAAALGTTPEAVRKRIQRGHLDGYKLAGQWRVRLPTPIDVEASAVAVRGSESGAIQPGELVAILREQLTGYQVTIREQERLIGQLRAELTRANSDLRAMERTLRRVLTMLPPEG